MIANLPLNCETASRDGECDVGFVNSVALNSDFILFPLAFQSKEPVRVWRREFVFSLAGKGPSL